MHDPALLSLIIVLALLLLSLHFAWRAPRRPRRSIEEVRREIKAFQERRHE